MTSVSTSAQAEVGAGTNPKKGPVMKKPTKKQKQDMLRTLLADRCENYGYDYQAFYRVCSQRYRAKRALRMHLAAGGELHWDRAPLAHRIDWESMQYVVGQSSNEEVTNLLRQLRNPNAKWVS